MRTKSITGRSIWKKLYDGKELNEKALEPVEEEDTEEYGNAILKSEFKRAVKDLIKKIRHQE
jgi:hypothetical protein